MRLTDTSIRGFPLEPAGSKKHWDETIPGFGVRCSAKTKSFFVMYGRDRRLKTIGKYPEISLREARSEARRLLAAKPEKRRLKSTTAAVSAYLEDRQTHLHPNTLREYRRHLKKAPEKPLEKLARSDINMTDPQAIKTWKVFFNWCIRNDLTDRNPFQHVPVVYGQRTRVLSHDELRQIWAYDYPPFSDFLRLQILTGQRRGQWDDYTLDEDKITFHAQSMKGKREHVLPLTDAVANLLPLEPFNGWSNAKVRLDKHVPLEPWVIHDLRRTFSTNCAALGIPLHVTEKILDHRSGSISGVAAIYNRHTYMPEMREALDRYAAHVESVVA